MLFNFLGWFNEFMKRIYICETEIYKQVKLQLEDECFAKPDVENYLNYLSDAKDNKKFGRIDSSVKFRETISSRKEVM